MEAHITTRSTSDEEMKIFLINMLQKCESEAKNNRLLIPLEDFEDRVLHYTGIPKTMLHEILKEVTAYPKPNTINFNTHLIILKSLSKFYERKEFPTFENLLQDVNEFIITLNGQGVQDAKRFKQDVKMLGIDYQTIFNDTKLLMEDPKITFERYSYLKKIKQIRQRENYRIYYISERIIDNDLNFSNPWKQNGQTSNICDGEFVLFHAISKNGFTNGLYCFSATEDDFYKWVVDILLVSLYPSSVVVLDNSPLHGTSQPKSLTMFDTKDDIKNWLRKHNVPFSDAMNKSLLYKLFKNHADIEEMPRVDRVIKANGHQVLRLPTHFEDLSPIEHIWQDIKRNLENKDDLHDKILSMLANMPKESYQLYDTDIEERENAMFLVDTEMDNVLDNFLSDLKNTDGGPT